jgi:hypothetical protein
LGVRPSVDLPADVAADKATVGGDVCGHGSIDIHERPVTGPARWDDPAMAKFNLFAAIEMLGAC